MSSPDPDEGVEGRLGMLGESPFISTVRVALTKPLSPDLVSAGSVRGAHFLRKRWSAGGEQQVSRCFHRRILFSPSESGAGTWLLVHRGDVDLEGSDVGHEEGQAAPVEHLRGKRPCVCPHS